MTDLHGPSTRAHELSLLHLELRKPPKKPMISRTIVLLWGCRTNSPPKNPSCIPICYFTEPHPGGVNSLLWSFKTLRSDYLDHLRRFSLIVGVLKNQRAFAECIEKQENTRWRQRGDVGFPLYADYYWLICQWRNKI